MPDGPARTCCDCSECASLCQAMPAYLALDDIRPLMRRLGPQGFFDKFCRTEGATVMNSATGAKMAVPTINPKQQPNGRCVFLTEDDKCSIHDIAPWGCRMFDPHMSDEEADRRQAHPEGVMSCLAPPYKELVAGLQPSQTSKHSRRAHLERLMHPHGSPTADPYANYTVLTLKPQDVSVGDVIVTADLLDRVTSVGAKSGSVFRFSICRSKPSEPSRPHVVENKRYAGSRADLKVLRPPVSPHTIRFPRRATILVNTCHVTPEDLCLLEEVCGGNAGPPTISAEVSPDINRVLLEPCGSFSVEAIALEACGFSQQFRVLVLQARLQAVDIIDLDSANPVITGLAQVAWP